VDTFSLNNVLSSDIDDSTATNSSGHVFPFCWLSVSVATSRYKCPKLWHTAWTRGQLCSMQFAEHSSTSFSLALVILRPRVTQCAQQTVAFRALVKRPAGFVFPEECHLACDAVKLLRTEVSEERVASIIRLTRISKLGTALAVTSNCWLFQSKNSSSSN
jgi:hypothetical protein